MNKLDYKAVKEHINIINVAYHLCFEITEESFTTAKVICPFCGYNKLSKVPTMTLYYKTNQYSCSRCNKSGYSRDLYARVKNIEIDKAYKELLERECYSQNKSKYTISPINILADISIRDKIYREFLDMLRLEKNHKNYLERFGFLNSTIEENLYKSIPKNKIKRRLIAYELSADYNLARNTWILPR